MSRFESQKVQVQANTYQTYAFLKDPRNLYELLPQDRIEDWVADDEHCSFRIRGLTKLDLHLVECVPYEQIQHRSGEEAPFPFTLSVHLSDLEEGTECQVICEAELNPFLEKMASDPLNRLFDHMAASIKELDLGNEAP